LHEETGEETQEVICDDTVRRWTAGLAALVNGEPQSCSLPDGRFCPPAPSPALFFASRASFPPSLLHTPPSLLASCTWTHCESKLLCAGCSQPYPCVSERAAPRAHAFSLAQTLSTHTQTQTHTMVGAGKEMMREERTRAGSEQGSRRVEDAPPRHDLRPTLPLTPTTQMTTFLLRRASCTTYGPPRTIDKQPIHSQSHTHTCARASGAPAMTGEGQ
jgi:hypothetical protein